MQVESSDLIFEFGQPDPVNILYLYGNALCKHVARDRYIPLYATKSLPCVASSFFGKYKQFRLALNELVSY